MSLENIHHYVILPIDHNERLTTVVICRSCVHMGSKIALSRIGGVINCHSVTESTKTGDMHTLI